MQLALISLLFLYSILLQGLTTVSGRNEVPKYNINTPLRVLLDKDLTEIKIKSVLNTLFIKEDGANRWTRFPGIVTIKLSRSAQRILVNQTPFESSAIYLRGGFQHTDPVQYENNFYRGALKITKTKKGLLMTNIIPVEEYLIGMIAGEMSPFWEMEALKAQVVAARTYAVYMITHPKHPLYDLEKGTSDQVYPGAQSEAETIKRAVKITQGQLLTLNQNPVKPYYHSRCGGNTESANFVWKESKASNASSVPCPFCKKFPYNWKKRLKTHEFLGLLKLPFESLKPFKVALVNRSPSGRVKEIAVETDSQKHLINSDELRQLLGYAHVKSTRFDIKIEDDQVTFEGVGSGHGVGMCQWGAQFLAKKGKTYQEILSHYYPNYHVRQPVVSLNP